jgi:hypothetical protein
MSHLLIRGQRRAFDPRAILLALAALILMSLALPIPAQAQVSAQATCEAWYWAGDCCCGSTRCTKERERQCTAENGSTYTEHQCSFWSTCS